MPRGRQRNKKIREKSRIVNHAKTVRLFCVYRFNSKIKNLCVQINVLMNIMFVILYFVVKKTFFLIK